MRLTRVGQDGNHRRRVVGVFPTDLLNVSRSSVDGSNRVCPGDPLNCTPFFKQEKGMIRAILSMKIKDFQH